MRHIVLLAAIFLLHRHEARGSEAGTPVFVQKGADLLLRVMAPVEVHIVDRTVVKWIINDKVNVVRLFHDNVTEVLARYKGRAEICPQNYSLLLKNVQHNDSGRYSAAVAGGENINVGTYIVTVQDGVTPVYGTVDLESSSSDICNFTVTCSTQDSHHIISTFSCDSHTCNQEEGGERSKVTTSGASLSVYLSNHFSVICNHSNQVSLAEHRTNIMDLCMSKPVTHIIVIVVVLTVVLVMILTAAVVRHRIKYQTFKIDTEGNTVYKTVQVNTLTEPLDQNPTESPHSNYSLVRPVSFKSTEARDVTLPESLYAQVDRSPSS